MSLGVSMGGCVARTKDAAQFLLCVDGEYSRQVQTLTGGCVHIKRLNHTEISEQEVSLSSLCSDVIR